MFHVLQYLLSISVQATGHNSLSSDINLVHDKSCQITLFNNIKMYNR